MPPPRFTDESLRADFLCTVKPRIFALSGHEALQAKIRGDDQALQRSGLPAFESALGEFLTTESGLVSLRLSAERITLLASQLAKELASRLNSGLPPAGATLEDDAPHLLRSLQGLVTEHRTRIEQQRVQTSSTLHAMLTALSADFNRIAEATYPNLNLGLQHLETPALSSFLDALAVHFTTPLQRSDPTSRFISFFHARSASDSIPLQPVSVGCDLRSCHASPVYWLRRVSYVRCVSAPSVLDKQTWLRCRPGGSRGELSLRQPVS